MRTSLLVALAALAAGSASAQEAEPEEAVALVLERFAASGDADAAVAELVELGPDAVPAAFDALVDSRGHVELMLEDALAASPHDAVTAAVEARLLAAPEPGPSERLQRVSLAVLERVGRADDLELCLLAAEVLGEETFAPRTRELTAALDAIHAREPHLLGVIERSWSSIEKRLRTPVTRSVANLGGDGALAFVTGLLERDHENAGMLLSQLGRVAHGGVSLEAGAEAADVARPFLEDERQGVAKEAAILLGRLDDDASVHALIPLLAHESEGVRGNAYWALQRLTGLSLPVDEPTWSAWYARERDWWARESRRAFRHLRDEDPARASAAVREIAEHRLARHSLARELAVALRHRAASVRRAAVDAFERIGSRAAVPALERALANPDPVTRERARAVLAELTGAEPADDRVAASPADSG